MKHSSFTLLEVILVVLILGLISSSALLVVDSQDNQLRYDETKRRLDLVKFAITGPEQNIILNNSIILKGYIADTGQMPSSIEDLISNDSNVRVYAEDADLGFSWGWRGPYITTFEAKFTDGWGYDFTFDNTTNPGVLAVTSLGQDGEVNGDDYNRDITLSINENSYRIKDLSVDFKLSLEEGDALATGQSEDFKVMILYPNSDADTDFPDTSSTSFTVPDKYLSTESWTIIESDASTFTKTLSFDNIEMFNGRALLYLVKEDSVSPGNYKVVSTTNISHEAVLLTNSAQPQITIELDVDKLL